MRSALIPALLLAAAIATTACEDSIGPPVPLLSTDTVTVTAPLPQNAGQPHALDITSAFGIRGGRYPERLRDAGEWDFAVRIENGQLVLVPAAVLGVAVSSPPAITRPLSGETMESLREAPGQSTFVSDSSIVMQEGAVYAARSREWVGEDVLGGFFVPCTQFAKMQPLLVDVENGVLQVHIVTNENCSDLRLDQVD